LNPVWAYLISPSKDTPTPPMLLGGAIIMLALLWRYLPPRHDASRERPESQRDDGQVRENMG
jgi:hypothetical protein